MSFLFIPCVNDVLNPYEYFLEVEWSFSAFHNATGRSDKEKRQEDEKIDRPSTDRENEDRDPEDEVRKDRTRVMRPDFQSEEPVSRNKEEMSPGEKGGHATPDDKDQKDSGKKEKRRDHAPRVYEEPKAPVSFMDLIQFIVSLSFIYLIVHLFSATLTMKMTNSLIFSKLIFKQIEHNAKWETNQSDLYILFVVALYPMGIDTVVMRIVQGEQEGISLRKTFSENFNHKKKIHVEFGILGTM